MGTIKQRFNLQSAGSTDTTSAGFNITLTDSLPITQPVVNLASGTVTSATGPDTLIGTGVTDITYIYIKYVSTSAGTPTMVVSTVAGTQDFADVTIGEAIFLPVKGSTGIRVTSSDTNTITYEYGYWTKDN